jgi:hypothetical protein
MGVAMKKKPAPTNDFSIHDGWQLLALLHEAKRNRNSALVESINQEFSKRDLVKVNQSIRGK